jgi:nucleotide-binding universal stress UspA family protein
VTTTSVPLTEAVPDGETPVASGAAAAGTARRVIVGIDDTPSGQAALRWAVRRASADGARLIAVRAWALGLPRHGGRRHRHLDRSPVVFTFAGDSQRAAATALVRRAFRRAVGVVPAAIAAEIEVPEGDPAVVLTQIAVADGDLLVLGDQYGSSLKRIVHGSVSRYCTAHSKCPVVIISPASAEYDGLAKSAEIRPSRGLELPDDAQVRGAS